MSVAGRGAASVRIDGPSIPSNRKRTLQNGYEQACRSENLGKESLDELVLESLVS
jgi:hypothetical protein